MIFVLRPGTTREHADEIMELIREKGCKPLYLPGEERVVLGAIGNERALADLRLHQHPEVESVKAILTPHRLVSREFHPHDTVVTVGDVPFGGENFVVVAGPCAVESLQQLVDSAKAVQAHGARCLRGGAFKPRTSPYSFQGLGETALDYLAKVGTEHGLPTITEVMDIADIRPVCEHCDACQVGARNMQNYRLLAALGECDKPVVLKRGPAAEIKELLSAAEYIVAAGNPNVILCERGIKTFERTTRYTLDLNAIPYLKQQTHLPVIVDPSHGTGIRSLVAPMTYAALACGADGVIVEVHPDPQVALSDGKQSLYPDQFGDLMRGLAPFAKAAGRML